MRALIALALTSFAVAQDPIPKLLKGVQPRRLIGDVEKLVSFETRHSFSDTASDETGIGAARRWLASEFEAISKATGGRLEVRTQTFEARTRAGSVEMVNVLGYLPGTVGPEGRTLIVSGHYDSRASNGMDGKSFAPGANDDASGTAVVLELARVLAGERFEPNLVFICVAGEEQGLFGAKHYAELCEEQGVDVVAMITGDIVGGVEGGNGVKDDRTIRCFSHAEDGVHSPSRELARSLRSSAERYVKDAVVELIFRRDRFGRGGDHIPFDDAGYAAVRLSEANEHYDRQHQDVREEDGVKYGDLPEFVSPEYMAKVARVSGACLVELALAPPRPEGLRMRAAVSYDTQLSWSPSPGAAGYEVVWRKTTEPTWTGSKRVAADIETLEGRSGSRQLVRATIEGVSADSYFFGVRALSEEGHRSRVTYPDRP